MRRAFSAAAAAFLLVFAACDTDPATDVTYGSATLHGQFKCQGGTFDATAQFELRQGAGTFEPVGPVYPFHCENQEGQEQEVPATTVGDLDHDSHYEYRLRASDNHWYDADGTTDGTNYDGFDTATFPTVSVRSAKSLRDSIGINTRTAFTDAHGNHAKVREALDYMGIRFCRDSLWPSWHTGQRNFLVSLAQAGIKCSLSPHYFGSFTTSPCATPNIAEFIARLENDSALRAVVDRVESTNEPSNDTAVQTCMRTYQQALYEAVKASPTLADRPVIAPSLFANTGIVGDIDAWTDFGNFHPYPNAFPPESEVGGAALQWNIDQVCRTHTADPCQATEWGYHTDLSVAAGHLGVSEATRSTYTLRGILELYRRGITRVDLYTIVAGSCEQGNGAPNSSDFGFYSCGWNPLPVADALRAFTQAVGDGAPTLAPLALRQDAGPADLRRLVFRRGDGTYVVALWRTPSVWNRTTKQPISVPAANVTLTLPDADTVDAARPVAGTTAPLTVTNDQVTVGVNGDPVLLVVTPEP